MSSLFISDLHLKPDAPELIALARRCLTDYAPQYDKLFILGDFVEYWLGDDAYDGSLDVVFDAIKNLGENGTAVYLMHGNRDFLLGDKIAEDLNLTLITEDYFVFEQDGLSVLLMHGDTLCTDDVDYQQLRQMLRDPQWQTHFLDLSIAERVAAAQSLRDKSQNQKQQKSAEIMDVNQQVVSSIMQEYALNNLIHGHTHRPDSHQFKINNQPYNRYVLGDWDVSKGAILASMIGREIKLIDWPIATSNVN